MPVWAGRSLALIGIVFVAANLRTGVAAISPITEQIGRDIPLDSVTIGIIGAIPPIAFALSGFFGGELAKRFGLERLLVVSLIAMALGHVVRALAPNLAVLIAGTTLALLTAGIGNVLLPPLVKRYFPDRIGLVTSAYLTLMSIGTALPPLLAAPVANAAGWRVSLVVWAGLAAAALVPWLLMIVRRRSELRALRASGDEAPEIDEPEPVIIAGIWHSKISWTLVAIFAISSGHTYALFAWLPQILRDLSNTTVAEGGGLLSLFAIASTPFALTVPIIVARYRKVRLVAYSGLATLVLGYLGFLLFPGLPIAWVLLLGAGPMLFPLCLTLVNIRTRTHEGAVALSAFGQGIGYAAGCLTPIIVGVLHDATGGWILPLVFLIATAAACALVAGRAGRSEFLEDELAARRS